MFKFRSWYRSLIWSIGQWLVNQKRRLLNWRGDGVHSPYAFNLIRQVLRCPHPYEAYRNLYDKAEAKCEKALYGTRAITEQRRLELLFRLVHSFAPKASAILSVPREREHLTSLSRRYVEATGYRHWAEDYRQADLLVMEAVPEGLMARSLVAHPEHYMLILNTQDAEVRLWAKTARAELQPPITFDLVGLQIWVWRPHTTSGHYPVYF